MVQNLHLVSLILCYMSNNIFYLINNRQNYLTSLATITHPITKSCPKVFLSIGQRFNYYKFAYHHIITFSNRPRGYTNSLQVWLIPIIRLLREGHELTCGLIWIRPAGIVVFKSLIRSHMDKFPQVICPNGSGTCNLMDHPQVNRYLQVPTGIHGYLLIYMNFSFFISQLFKGI